MSLHVFATDCKTKTEIKNFDFHNTLVCHLFRTTLLNHKLWALGTQNEKKNPTGADDRTLMVRIAQRVEYQLMKENQLFFPWTGRYLQDTTTKK